MHKCSSIAVIICTLLINQYVYCSDKREDNWWNDFKTKLESRQKNQWTEVDNKSIPLIAASTSRSVKRSSIAFDDFSDSPVRSRSRGWEKSYTRRRDFDNTWSDGQPVRERFIETEWDDDQPVRHVFRDSSSSIDEGSNRIRNGDDIRSDRTSRPWTRGDYNGNTGRSGMRDIFDNARSVNKNNNKSNNKPKVGTNTQGKADRTDRVLNLSFQDSDTKKKDRDRLDQLAKQIFGDREGTITTGGDRDVSTTRGSGNTGGGYVTNAVNSFGNSYVTSNPMNVRNSNNNNKQNINSNINSNVLSKPLKPKFNANSETTSAKPDRTSNTAKTNANDIRGVVEKPKTSTTPSSPNSQPKFGWRSSISHTNDQKTQNQNQNQKLQKSCELCDDKSEGIDSFEDIDDYEGDDTTTTRPITTRTPTLAPIRATTRPMTRATVRTTTRPQVEYTTYRLPETTRPQTTPAVTNRATFQTTARPKAIVITPKTSTNALDNNLAPNKKQHRMGSWVDSDSLDYEEKDNEDFSDDRALVDAPVVDDRALPLIDEGELDNEQLPERVEDLPPAEPIQFARQSAGRSEGDDDDQPGWRLEDALPGTPGTDYPTFATIPRTAFDCKAQEWPGYYADVETQCQVFHICQTGGRKNSFLCPNGTMFNQALFVCDWWHNVQCGDSATHYQLNENIYDNNWESKRISNTDSDSTVRRSGALIDGEDPLTGDLTTISPDDSDSDSESNDVNDLAENTGNNKDVSNEFNDDVDNDETDRTTRVRSPIRVYRTSRILTAQDRQRRRRRKRGYLKA